MGIGINQTIQLFIGLSNFRIHDRNVLRSTKLSD